MQVRRTIHFWAFAAVISICPLPLGANRPWSWSVLAVTVGILVLLIPWANTNRSIIPRNLYRALAPPATLVGLSLAWAVLQTSTFLPDSWSHPVWSVAAAAVAQPANFVGRVAVDLGAARTELMLFLVYGAVFWIALQYGRSRGRASLLLDIILVSTALYALYGLVALTIGGDTVLGREKFAYQGELTGTFINPNHFATYLGLGLLCACASFALYFSRSRGQLGRLKWSGLLGYAAVVLVLLTALLATSSRAGLVAVACGLLVFGGTMLVAVTEPGAARARAIATLLVLFVLGWAIAGFALSTVWYSIAGADDRHRVYEIVVALIAERPWLGHGLGSFAPVFAEARPYTVTQIWTEAHNGYLELTLELGLVAAGMVLFSLAWLAGLCVRGLAVRRRDLAYPGAGLAACGLVSTHALVDFSLQIPAVTTVWMTILGVAVGQSWAMPRRRSRVPTDGASSAQELPSKQNGEP